MLADQVFLWACVADLFATCSWMFWHNHFTCSWSRKLQLGCSDTFCHIMCLAILATHDALLMNYQHSAESNHLIICRDGKEQFYFLFIVISCGSQASESSATVNSTVTRWDARSTALQRSHKLVCLLVWWELWDLPSSWHPWGAQIAASFSATWCGGLQVWPHIICLPFFSARLKSGPKWAG